MSIKPIYKDNFTFCPPLPGKPNPKKSYTDTAPLAERVLQSGQKELTCLYYALNFIRHRIGKNPTEAQKESREVEMMISDRRKKQTKLQKDWFLYKIFASDLTNEQPSRTFGKNEVERFIKNQFLKVEEPYKKPFLSLITMFYKQSDYTDLLTFTEETYAKKMIQIDQMFLKKAYGSSLNLEVLAKAITASLKSTERCTFERQYVHLNEFVNQTIFKLYNLQKSSWHPQLPIDSLILNLRNHGPHVFGGFIGRCYYKDESIVVGKVGSKNIYGWKAGAEKVKGRVLHAVVVVGAKKVITGNKKDLVYFVDPSDNSDPKNADAPKVYVMTYKGFLEKISTIEGQIVDDLKDNKVGCLPRKKDENHYALYGPEKTFPSTGSSSLSSGSSSISTSSSLSPSSQ